MTKIVAMIPARMGSQRLKRKNLRELGGVPLITRAIRKCKEARCFDEIWVNSEDIVFKEIAEKEGVMFHQRPEALGDNHATSEQFVYEFLKHHSCTAIVQVHSIAPLLSSEEVSSFVMNYVESEYDVLLSCIEDQIEVAYQNEPVNFAFARKNNSQDLKPVQRITWSITAWNSKTYMEAYESQKCATYSGSIGFHPVSSMSGHVIKTQRDLELAEAMLKVVNL